MSLKSRLRPIALAIVLLAGSFGGVAMRPEDIEALLNAHNQTKIEQVVRKEQDDEDGKLQRAGIRS